MDKKIESTRQLRIAKQIERLMMQVFLNRDFKFEGRHVSFEIMKVEISKDLRNVKIMLDIPDFSDPDKKYIIKDLNNKVNKEIKQLLVPHLRHLKYMQEFRFFLDKSKAQLSRINQLLEEESKLFKDEE